MPTAPARELRMPLSAERFRSLLILLLVAGGALLALAAGRHYGERRALHAEALRAREQLALHANALQALLGRYRAVPAVLALDPELQALLAAPGDGALQARINRKLERINRLTGASTLTLVDRAGVGLAASNWAEPASNIGYDYSFRPYYQQAVAQGHGDFYGVGVTTGVPGYFLAQALSDAQDRVQGVVVVKIDLAVLEREWAQSRDRVLLSDAQGVVFLANRPQWRYRALAPLPPTVRSALAATQQYADQPLPPLRARLLAALGDDGRRLRLQQPEAGAEVLWQSRPLLQPHWTLHLLTATGPAIAAGRVDGLAAAGGWLALIFLLLFLQQRRRLERLRRRSRAELEEMVKQHTAALRTAQDSVVQAARQAALGQGASLEHLPQGVSVIDAGLRLVAWNRRYVEIFRYPAELMQVGRPIEDLLRYNARRGLLGPGSAEEAVQRRLEHLRARTPYLHERERPDGMVLEIRGNPLPDGGFVTSYADITSYRNAARDLRTLAASLEQRIAERTRDLEAARREAEQANRAKTRFVAAVVHDLRQPLNAARLFLGALRPSAAAAKEQELFDGIEHALATQDETLATLMDISRLEAGTLDVRRREFALGPLLDTLGREFALLAGERGLRLRHRGTRAVVDSDEALLRRILQNFLSNAIRYNRPQGRVLLGVRRQGAAALRIEVWDTGPGIPETQRAAVFEEFRRLDGAQASREPGAGLGLAIVDRIAQRLGHAIGLRSWPGRGSVFSVTVHCRRERSSMAPATALPSVPPVIADDDSPLQGCSVWCVDDDAPVRAAMLALLQRWGCRVTLARDATEALALSGAAPAPQLLLLDYRLGDGNGLALLAELRQRLGSAVPAILLSAEADATLPVAAAAAGAAFLAKPLRPPALRALMTQLLLRGS